MSDMADTMEMELVLTGARAGKTIKLRDIQFTDGRAKINGPIDKVKGVATYYGRTYKAFPVGSKALQTAQENDNGNSNLQASAGSRTANKVPGDAQSARNTGQANADNAGNDNAKTTGAGNSASGDGKGVVKLSPAEEDAKITEALKLLDGKDDEHWTGQGKPALAIVTELTGIKVTRARLDALAPNFDRSVATQ